MALALAADAIRLAALPVSLAFLLHRQLLRLQLRAARSMWSLLRGRWKNIRPGRPDVRSPEEFIVEHVIVGALLLTPLLLLLPTVALHVALLGCAHHALAAGGPGRMFFHRPRRRLHMERAARSCSRRSWRCRRKASDTGSAASRMASAARASAMGRPNAPESRAAARTASAEKGATRAPALPLRPSKPRVIEPRLALSCVCSFMPRGEPSSSARPGSRSASRTLSG